MLPNYEITVDSNCVIESIHEFNFSVNRLYTAFSNAEYLQQWWGPHGFTNTFYIFDFKPMGNWSFVMHGPNGANYQNDCQFLVIKPNEKLVWNHHSNPKFQMNVQFVPLEEQKSKLIFGMRFLSSEQCQALKAFILEKNEENFQRLTPILFKIPG
ncbi:MAG: SRPBCC domain-containing protein [Bacteroidia bacterium]|nr:SRPBCC domain-containing protein [Bacteroidia bacterium]